MNLLDKGKNKRGRKTNRKKIEAGAFEKGFKSLANFVKKESTKGQRPLPWEIMKIITWNYSYLANHDKCKIIKHHLEKLSSDTILQQEKKYNQDEGGKFVKFQNGQMDVFQGAIGISHGLNII